MIDPRLDYREHSIPPTYVREDKAHTAAITAKLPAAAAAKLRAFEDAALAAEGALQAAQERRNELARPVMELRRAVAESDAPNPVTVQHLAELEPEFEHREEVLLRFRAASIAANAVLGNITRALADLPRTACFVEASAPEAKKGQTLTSVRETVANVTRDIHALNTSAPTTEEQEAALKAAIAKRGEIGRPRMDRSGRLRTEAAANAQAAALAVACWLDPEGVFARMVEDGALREGGTVSASEKAAALATLRASLFEAELLEEALIQRDGGARRNDADPFAVLGVRVEVGAKARLRAA